MDGNMEPLKKKFKKTRAKKEGKTETVVNVNKKKIKDRRLGEPDESEELEQDEWSIGDEDEDREYWEERAKGAAETLKVLKQMLGGEEDEEEEDSIEDDEHFFKRMFKEYEDEFGEVQDEEDEEKPKKKKKTKKEGTKREGDAMPPQTEAKDGKKKKKKPTVQAAEPGVEKKKLLKEKKTEDSLPSEDSKQNPEHAARKQRQKERAQLAAEMEESIADVEGATLEDVKRMVNTAVREGKITREEAGQVVKKWKSREHRRVGRQLQKNTNAACFGCREPGHTLAECPKREAIGEGTGICFKCGSTEHKVHRCPRGQQIKGFPYASCFICGEKGHLSKECGKNKSGVYPDGGSCNLCGDTMHLKKDCPMLRRERRKAQGGDGRPEFAATWRGDQGADEDDAPWEGEKKDGSKKRKPKLVKF